MENSLETVLRSVGLEHCIRTLEEDDIDLDCLLLFTNDDVDDLSISQSDKKKLLKIINTTRIDCELKANAKDTENSIQEVNDFLFDDVEDSNMYIRTEQSQQGEHMNNINNKTNRFEVERKRFEEATEHVNQAFVKVFNDPSVLVCSSPTSSFPSLSTDSSGKSLRRLSSDNVKSEVVLTNNIAVGIELMPRDTPLGIEVSQSRGGRSMGSTSSQVGEIVPGGQVHSSENMGAIHRLSPPPPPLASPAAILEVTSSLSKEDTSFESWLASQETKYQSTPKARQPPPHRTQFHHYVEQRRTSRRKGGNGNLPSLNSLNNITTLKASYSEPKINVITWGFSGDMSWHNSGASHHILGKAKGGQIVPTRSVMSSHIHRSNPVIRGNQRSRLATPQLSRHVPQRAPQQGLPPRALNGSWAARQTSVRSERRPPLPSQLPKLTLSNSAPSHY